MSRLSWDEYFLVVAQATALRSTCTRRQVGAVLTAGGQIVATGYNGSLPGVPHCIDAGCLVVQGHCARCYHAEANALLQAQKRKVEGDTLYCTDQPCLNCSRLAISMGVEQVIYRSPYPDPARDAFLKDAGLGGRFVQRVAPELVWEGSK